MASLAVMPVVFVALALAATAAADGDVRAKQHLAIKHSGWERIGRADPAAVLAGPGLTVSLELRRPGSIVARANAVSDPDSPLYGHYATRDELDELSAPSQRALEAVAKLRRELSGESGDLVPMVFLAPDVVRFPRALVGDVARALGGADLCEYRHPDLRFGTIMRVAPDGQRAVLPEGLVAAFGLEDFPLPGPRAAARRSERKGPARDSSSGNSDNNSNRNMDRTPRFVRPSTVFEWYENNRTTPVGNRNHSATSLGIAEFSHVWYSPSDLKKFQAKYGLQVEPVVQLGPVKDQTYLPSQEGNLDVQWGSAVAQNVSLYSYIEPCCGFDLIVFAMEVLQADVQVWSVSYGGEALSDYNQSFTRSLDEQFAKAAVRGVTMVFASGDNGVYNYEVPRPNRPFGAAYPAVLPHVLSVGGTAMLGEEYVHQEMAWDTSSGASSGGFADSRYFKRSVDCPWQDATVTAYFKQERGFLPNSALYDQAGCAFPDVSAFAHNILIEWNGLPIPVDGTSASAPIFAGFIALLNSVQASRGKPALGFASPLFFKRGHLMLNDVKQGSNIIHPGSGFYAVRGWDPVTGFGTPNWDKMVKNLP